MNKYPFFAYKSGDSKVHMMNSKYKILWVIISILLCFMIKDNISLLIFSLSILFMIINTNISIEAYLANIFKVWYLFLIVFGICFGLSFDLYFSVFVSVKVLLFVLILLILTFTTSLSEIAWGIECLFSRLKKFKIPVSKIALTVALYIKFISTLFDQYENIRKSMAYRGIPYHRKRNKIIIPVIFLSYRLSKRMISAMKMRMYGYSNRRTNYHENKKTNFDKLVVFPLFAIIYIALWLGWIR